MLLRGWLASLSSGLHRCAAVRGARSCARATVSSPRASGQPQAAARLCTPLRSSRAWSGTAAGGGGEEARSAARAQRRGGEWSKEAVEAELAGAEEDDAQTDGAPLVEATFDLEDEVFGGDAQDEEAEDQEPGEEGEDEEEGELEEEDYDPSFTTGGVAWGESALAVARSVVESPPFAGVLEMYSFRVFPTAGRIIVRLDKPSDRFGSPMVDELSAFSAAFDAALDVAKLSPDELTVEVSSAGAERLSRALTQLRRCSEVRVPRDLARFKGLPMRVRYSTAAADGGAPSETVELLELLSWDEGAGETVWKVADVRQNRAHLKKGQPLSKKVKERRLNLRTDALKQIHLVVDV